MVNKAHAATMRRICERYGGSTNHTDGVDVVVGNLRIEIETWATLTEGIDRLTALNGFRYVAVTNKDAIPDALRLVDGTGIGVMDPQGRILFAAAGHEDASDE